jgi:hypothetical protein
VKALEEAGRPIADSAAILAEKFEATAKTAVAVRQEFEQTVPAARAVTQQLGQAGKELNDFAEIVTRTRESTQSWFRGLFNR